MAVEKNNPMMKIDISLLNRSYGHGRFRIGITLKTFKTVRSHKRYGLLTRPMCLGKQKPAQKTIQEMYIAAKKKASYRRDAGIGYPPGHLWQIPITMNDADLREDVDPSVHESNISGQYMDGKHCINVHFSLLTEYLVGLFREDIAKYHQFVKAASTDRPGARQALAAMEAKNVYRLVKVPQMEFTESGKILVLQLDVACLQNVKWGQSKRLLTGSLLCISPDNFANIALATVVRRKAKDLKNGKLGVQIIEGRDVLDSPKFQCSEFILAESHFYFEAVGSTLRGLQALAGDQFPFNKYVIELNANMDPPRYATPELKYDLSPLLCKSRKYNKDQLLCQRWVPILHADQWPDKYEFGFDESQFQAFKAALTKQLAIIQGPPGTGKTFLGQKIVKTLIHNCDAWITRTAPILILCYTNHALDQFLAGILDEVGPKGIVRVGGRSHFQKLKPHNIKELGKNEIGLLNNIPRTTRQGSQNIQMKLMKLEWEEDIGILRNAAILGMTTADAVKCRAVLQVIRPQIVIVEEAAEICDSHIVAALTQDCDHLILIGDRQQLVPNPNVCKLGASLFKRLMKNGIPYESLKIQHRMRPEISGLLVPNFYKELYNDPSVVLRPPIKGVGHNMYFISHGIYEENASDSTSKEDRFEAEYAVALCRHLILQGYEKEKITVLTTRVRQMHRLQKRMNTPEYKGVIITVPDDYQCEENDIVILSLVRNTAGCNIGFLEFKNRVCVALSRARIGLFAIGNFDFMMKNSGRMWKPIVSHVARAGLIGPALRLVCQKHRDFTVEAKSAADFKLSPEGGCCRPCNFRLSCGHRCSLLCHNYDPEHETEKTRCRKPCVKTCKRGHSCVKMCYEECKCSSVFTFKNCGHKVNVCHQTYKNIKCHEMCNKRLSCGHKCHYKCMDKCEYLCQKSVPGQCKHIRVKCYEKYLPNYQKCSIACSQTLGCGHTCSGTCDDCHQGRIHKQCQEMCSRVLVCGHPCSAPCTMVCPPCTKRCENSCIHAKICNNICGVPCQPCKEKCPWQCAHHKCTKPCFMECDRPPCQEPCKLPLKCGHTCIGMCGEPCPDMCRICNHRMVCEIIFGNENNRNARFVLLEDCGHIIEVNAMDNWMKEDGDETQHHAVNMKGCPICKTVIRKSIRYGNQLKKMQMNVREVRQRIGDQMQRKESWTKEIKAKVQTTSVLKFGTIKTKIQKSLARHLIAEFEYNLLNNLVAFANTIEKYNSFIAAMETSSLQGFFKTNVWAVRHHWAFKARLKAIRYHLIPIENWILKMVSLQKRKYVSEQQLYDVARELYRVAFLIKLFQMLYVNPHNKTIVGLYYNAMSLVDSTKPFTEKRQNAVKNITRQMGRILCDPEIPNMRRFQVVMATGMNNGVWFKCPNGHIYINTDCNETLIKERCYECQRIINADNTASQEAIDLPARNYFSNELEYK